MKLYNNYGYKEFIFADAVSNPDIKKNQIMSTGKLFLGILAGVTAGLLLGISFAPYPKIVAPQKLSKKEKDLANDLK
jgi:hypothetical protein